MLLVLMNSLGDSLEDFGSISVHENKRTSLAVLSILHDRYYITLLSSLLFFSVAMITSSS